MYQPDRHVLPLGGVCVLLPLELVSWRISDTYRHIPRSPQLRHIYSLAASYVCVPD